MNQPLDIWLDSGAFSAWNSGASIDLELYIAYIKANIEFITHYVNLDVIPATPGEMPTAAQVEQSAAAGWDNMLQMNAEGLKPIPVFHMGERFHWLDKMLAHGCDYIGISPANDRPTIRKQEWLDRVFDRITDAQGKAIVRTHAFGVTSVPLVMRYPWYSVDSASWMRTAGYGCIMVPKRKPGGGYDFTVTADVHNISDRPEDGPLVGKLLERQAVLNDPRKIEHIQGWLHHCGTTLEKCKSDYLERAVTCVSFFLGLQAAATGNTYRRHRVHLFSE